MQLPLKKHVYLENLERNVFSRQLFHCLHSEKPFTASFKCLGLNMRAITPWRLLPKPLSTDEAWHIFFFFKSQILSSVFRVSRPRVTLVQRQRTRGVPENQILHFYSVTHKTASQAFLLWKDFLKALEGKKGDTERDQWTLLHFPREDFSKGHSAHSHTNLHWVALSTVLLRQEFCPESPS